jgi:hypothetical protein
VRNHIHFEVTRRRIVPIVKGPHRDALSQWRESE